MRICENCWVGGIQDAPDLAGGRRDWPLEISPVLAEGTDKRTDESEAREREQIGIFAYAHLRTEGVRATIKFAMGAMIVW